MSLGEDCVRVKFNPSSDSVVDNIKTKSAELIDMCTVIWQQTGNPETQRLLELAMTRYEEAAMWAVKAATAPPAKPSKHWTQYEPSEIRFKTPDQDPGY
jgi:hypothetical protein